MKNNDVCTFVGDISGALSVEAKKHDDYRTFWDSAEVEAIIGKWVKFARDEMGLDRADAYRRIQKAGAIAFEQYHTGTMWKTFHVRRGDERTYLMSYTLSGEGVHEEKSTIELLAYENSCDFSSIEIGYRFKPTTDTMTEIMTEA